jgi:hypothetical protein
MASSPFPSFHRGANQAAADKADHARVARERADQLIDEIDDLIGTTTRRG